MDKKEEISMKDNDEEDDEIDMEFYVICGVAFIIGLIMIICIVLNIISLIKLIMG